MSRRTLAEDRARPSVRPFSRVAGGGGFCQEESDEDEGEGDGDGDGDGEGSSSRAEVGNPMFVAPSDTSDPTLEDSTSAHLANKRRVARISGRRSLATP